MPKIYYRRIAYNVLARLVWLLRIRFIRLTHPERIGHLALEPDCYAKDKMLARRREITVLLADPDKIANPCLLELWRQHYIVVRSPRLMRFLRPLQQYPFLDRFLIAYAVAINDTATCYTTHRNWGRRDPLLKLPPPQRQAGRALLAKMGVPEGAWFVCVHSREGGYSPHDEHLHSYRNSDIHDYVPAMQAIVAAGGWCIRVGDPTMRPLSPPISGVIDYALSPHKSAGMDVFLAAECRFMLGNSSGLYILAATFGKPCALANQAPLSGVYGIGIDDLAIPKRLKRDGAFLSVGSLLRSPAGNYRFSEQYEEEGLEIVNNTPAEILALTTEMLERLGGAAVYTADDEARQDRFRSLFAKGHYSYGAASRIGRDFLRNLDDPAIRSA
ncbi:MAG: TIGR04372 family glycosyltransferase [Alphaproteobacteria bacterium]|nr:TIGR04372 family glycosyltransferase [Alphaproteobacteria bacterium]MCW5738697.1 TIGR04372 family glycosyltransferase [Alphaproteobacteria bacterium]